MLKILLIKVWAEWLEDWSQISRHTDIKGLHCNAFSNCLWNLSGWFLFVLTWNCIQFCFSSWFLLYLFIAKPLMSYLLLFYHLFLLFTLYAYELIVTYELSLCRWHQLFASKQYESCASSKHKRPPPFFVVQCITLKSYMWTDVFSKPSYIPDCGQHRLSNLNGMHACMYICIHTVHTYIHTYTYFRLKLQNRWAIDIRCIIEHITSQSAVKWFAIWRMTKSWTRLGFWVFIRIGKMTACWGGGWVVWEKFKISSDWWLCWQGLSDHMTIYSETMTMQTLNT